MTHQELVKDGLVNEDEVQDVWLQVVGPSLKASVDYQGFLRVHDAIDTLFEEEEEEEKGEEKDHMKAEFDMLCRGGKKVSLDAFMELPEIQEFLDEGALSADEVQDLWGRVAGPEDMGLDYEGFVKLYKMVDDLFEDAGGEEEDDTSVSASTTTTTIKATPPPPPSPPSPPKASQQPPAPSVTPGSYFAKKSDRGEMSREVVKDYPGIKDLIDEEDLGEDEFNVIWDKVSKGTSTVDFRGYQAILEAVDDLFEEDEEEDMAQPPQPPKPFTAPATTASTTIPSAATPSKPEPTGVPALSPDISSSFWASATAVPTDVDKKVDPANAKAVLKQLVASIPLAQQLQVEEDPDPEVLSLVDSLSQSRENIANDLDLALEDVEDVLVGEWELVYTTSRSMKYNSGLTGLGNTLPQAELLGVSQTISLDNFDSYDVYTTEKLLTLGRNLDAVIDGTWELLSTYSIMTGEPVLTMNIEPIRIKYGTLSDSMETGWKGARVLNRCEVIYLDDEIRVMKGGSNDCFFVWYRKTDS